MKRLFILSLISIFSATAQAQALGEVFNQKATQKKYLLQQIAGLQLYISYIQKGYSIAHDGLRLVGDIKNGELDLHSNYFNSLKKVNPNIQKYSRVADIIGLQLKIINVYKNALSQLKKSKVFNAEELKYTSEVFSRIIDACMKSMDELTMIITSNELGMKDDERIKRIDVIYNDMQDYYSFVQRFAREAKILSVSRLREQKDIQTSRVLNGIKK